MSDTVEAARRTIIEAWIGLDAWADDAERSDWIELLDTYAAAIRSESAGTGLDVDDLRARIETNAKVYDRRLLNGTGTEFDRGKAAGFRVVLAMLDPRPSEPSFSCGRPARLSSSDTGR